MKSGSQAAVPGGLARTLRAATAMGWRANRVALIGQLTAVAAAGLAPVAAAWLLRAILDGLTGNRDHHNLLGLVLLLGVAAGATAVLPSVTQYLSSRAGLAIQRQATADLFTAVTRLQGLRRLEDPRFQDRLRVAEQGGSSGPVQIMSSGMATFQAGLTLSGFLVTLLLLSPVIAVVVIAAAAPAVYLERGIARQQVGLITGISHGQRRQFFYQQLLSSLNAAKEIRLFKLGGYFRGRMLAEQSEIQLATARVNRRVLASNAAMAAMSALVCTAGLAWAVSAAARGELTIGDVSVFMAALGSGATTIGVLVSSAAITYQALLTFGIYRAVLAEGPDLPVSADPLPARQLRRGIEVDDVWFRYGPGNPWILRGVSCFIPHGEAVALVGHNGSGKSTLVKLLCRFYDPDRGRILWDGIDLRDLDPGRLRDRISVVFQDYMAYELTAAENIGVGDLELAGRHDLLAAAASRAGVHDVLAALPKGYQTLLTQTFFDLADKADPQTGVLLSGGQWQRLALARAFLRGGRDLMILDEPSSGLDPEAEHEIHAGLAAARAGRATVLISHRLNTVRTAEHILVLADGVVSEQGDHDALMARAGTYARLFELQAQGYADQVAATDGK
jgi:ATP-binding cassette subfamily B protein